MGFYQPQKGGGSQQKPRRTPGKLHDDQRWRSMLWAFIGIVLGFLLGAIGTAVFGESVNRPAITATPVSPPSPAAEDCSLTADGVVIGTPCLLDAGTLSTLLDVDRPMDVSDALPLPTCTRGENGAILGAPCRVVANLPAVTVASLDIGGDEAGDGTVTIPDLPDACTIGADGSVSGAAGGSCLLTRNIPAAPVMPSCRISQVDGTVTGAPCRLVANFRALNAGRTLEAEMEPRPAPPAPAPAPTLADCRINAQDQSITNTPCQLGSSFRPDLTGTSFGPVPKTALRVCPTRGFSTPEDLGCGLRVRDSGYIALSKIAEAYYGDKDAACLIYDRNRDVFGTRDAPLRRDDPHCILPEDILFMPATALDEDFGRCETPPKRANVCLGG